MFVNLEDSDNSGNESQIVPISDSDSAQQFRVDIINDNNTIDRLYILYMESKSTQVVRRNKNITPIMNKLEEVHADL